MSGFYGPALPPGLAGTQSDEAEKEAEDGTTAVISRAESPARSASVYGPVLPPPDVHEDSNVCSTVLDTKPNREHTYGPQLSRTNELAGHEECHDNRQGEHVHHSISPHSSIALMQ